MATRLQLQTKLEELLGCRHVYYQPPESIKMEYPAIRYSKSNIGNNFADDIKYSSHNRYEISVIDRSPDNPVIEKLLELPLCKYDRHYTSDGLNHDVLTLYF